MKRISAIVGLLAALMGALAAPAHAQSLQPNWKFNLKADNGYGRHAMYNLQIGVSSLSRDGYGQDGCASDVWDCPPSYLLGESTRGVVSLQKSGSKYASWVVDTQSARSPLADTYDAGKPGPSGSILGTTEYYGANQKIWDLRVFAASAGEQSTAGNIIRLQFNTISDLLPPCTIQDRTDTARQARYFLRMVDNKNVENAPANTTTWEVPVPTAHSADAWFSLTLPLLEIDEACESLAISQGYKMQFIQEMASEPDSSDSLVPEPGSLTALAGGLMGLAGYVRRRRG